MSKSVVAEYARGFKSSAEQFRLILVASGILNFLSQVESLKVEEGLPYYS